MEDIKDRIEYLAGFATDRRRELLEDVLRERSSYMRVCMENIYYAHNASAVIRSAESFGVQHIDIVEDHIPFEASQDIVRGTDKWVTMDRYAMKDASQVLINKLRADGYRIVATSPHDGDFTPESFDISTPFAVFFGTEKQGISDVVEREADAFIKIPMYGFVESLNISVCAAIIMQRLMDRLRSSSLDWRLSSQEYDAVLLEWLKCSVKDADGILANFDKIKSGTKLNEGSLANYIESNYKK